MNGILVINKEKGYTSRDVVNILCKKFNTKKIGHTGTLDPIATGVLVVCVGRYTKLVDKITCYDKEYVATIQLGIQTDTLDITGEVIEKGEIPFVDNYTLIHTLQSFVGKSLQEVPVYSAIKINGKKLYNYARKHEDVELPKREIEIQSMELLTNENGKISFRCVVSKGTYIRSLIRDICEKLGVIGTMCDLKRTRQGKFLIENACVLQDVDKCRLLTILDVFDYPHYVLNEQEYFQVSNGVPLEIQENEPYLMMEYHGEVVAIYQQNETIYKMYFKVM